MVKSELGSLDGNIFFPSISKRASIYYKSSNSNEYGRPKTKQKNRVSRSTLRNKKNKIFHKSQMLNLSTVISETKDSTAIKMKLSSNDYDAPVVAKEINKDVSPFKKNSSTYSLGSETEFERRVALSPVSKRNQSSKRGFSLEKQNNGKLMYQSFQQRKESDLKVQAMKNRLFKLRNDIENNEKSIKKKETKQVSFRKARELYNKDLHLKLSEKNKKMKKLLNDRNKYKSLYVTRKSNQTIIRQDSISYKRAIKEEVQNNNKKLAKEKVFLLKQDFGRRKKLHDNILKFKNQLKLNKIQSDYEMKEATFESNIKQRLNDNSNTMSRNDEIIRRMKAKENEYMEKLKLTLDRQKAFTQIN
mmetsp:Transcript_11770/g.10410  ORF Transcript_11770/g.10410 Transcript_11770/m.10410 type:complete len:359 (-) Transcript_11770:42-1118(-)